VKEQGRHDGVLALQGFSFSFFLNYKFGYRTDMKVILKYSFKFLGIFLIEKYGDLSKNKKKLAN